MTTLEIPAGALWADRFSEPDHEALVDGIGADLRGPFDLVREELLEWGLSEYLAWHGPSYRWSLSYAARKSDKAEFYLVPRPSSPFLAAPVPVERLAEIETRALDRGFREQIVGASVVGPTAWCVWPLVTKTGADSVVSGLRMLFRAGESVSG